MGFSRHGADDTIVVNPEPRMDDPIWDVAPVAAHEMVHIIRLLVKFMHRIS